jgi:hypothetical protein
MPKIQGKVEGEFESEDLAVTILTLGVSLSTIREPGGFSQQTR